MATITRAVDTVRSNSAFAVRVLAISLLVGFLMSTFWSAEFVDQEIGNSWSDSILGGDASEMEIGSVGLGFFYALVTGFAGTFTACNICAFSAIAPLAGEKRTVGKVLTPLLYLSAGLIAVAAIYGAIGAILGEGHLQLNQTRLGDPETGIRVRSLQSMAVFGSIGIIFILWGMMSIGLVRNPFAGVAARYPWARSVFMGALIGGFLIGRPFGLFRHMFEFAAATHNPAVGALSFVLQGLGNIIIMVVLFLFLVYGTGGRFERWLHAKPGRIQTVTATALIIGGTFFFTYWVPRLLARNGLFYWPFWDWDTLKLMFIRIPS